MTDPRRPPDVPREASPWVALESTSPALRATSWWGLVVGLAALASVLSTLVFAYVYLGSRADAWPPAGTSAPGLVSSTSATVAAVLSAVTAGFAQTTVRAEGRRRLHIGVAATVALGVAFTTLVAIDVVSFDFGLDSHAYGSVVLVTLGFQLLVTAVGLILLAVLPWHAREGGASAPRTATQTVNAALFWYFVVGTWLVVYLMVYVSPAVWP